MHSLNEIITERRIRSVLIVVNRFNTFSGPSMIAVDLAKTFARYGASVTIAAAMGGKKNFADKFPEISHFADLRDDPKPIILGFYDVVITQGWNASCFGLLECGIHYRALIIGSFSSLLAGEAIIGLENEADTLWFHSRRNRLLQEPSLSACSTPKHVYNNSLTLEWFKNPHQPTSDLSRVAIVSNHLPAELIKLSDKLVDYGISCEHIGKGGRAQEVTPHLIDSFDAIITIGHTVQKSLVRLRPVFCYDHFGGPGYLLTGNFRSAEDHGFSGRSHPLRLGAEDIFCRLVNEYSMARRQTLEMSYYFNLAFDLERVVAAALEHAAMTTYRTARNSRYRNLRKIFQHALSSDPLSPFVRNIGFDYEAEPVVIYTAVEGSSFEGLVDVAVTGLPPYLFGSTLPSPVTFSLQLKVEGRLDVERIIAVLSDCCVLEVSFRTSKSKASNGSLTTTIHIKQSIEVGVQPISINFYLINMQSKFPLVTLLFSTEKV